MVGAGAPMVASTLPASWQNKSFIAVAIPAAPMHYIFAPRHGEEHGHQMAP